MDNNSNKCQAGGFVYGWPKYLIWYSLLGVGYAIGYPVMAAGDIAVKGLERFRKRSPKSKPKKQQVVTVDSLAFLID